jgi:DNA-binding CsgD family transcriptional regulator/tetratricopeptide (TPR) repeat protein
MSVAADWPLVGRDEELSQVLDVLVAGRGVVIGGGAGVGKTRLAVACLEEAHKRGFLPFRVAATLSTAEVPFGAFAALLPEFDPGLDRTEMLRRIAASIEARGDGAKIALLIDDAHLLDEGEAALTSQLVLGHGVFVIVTVRAGEPTRDAVTQLWKDQLAVRIDLHPLSESQVSELLTEVLGAPVEGLTVRRLHARSSGNVLYLRELVLGSLAGNTLRFDGSLWRIEQYGPDEVSERLSELVEVNLCRLSPAERLGVEYLAFGEPLDADAFARLTGAGVDVNGLETRRLVRSQLRDDRVELTLAHPIYGEVLRKGVSDLKARELVGELANEYARLEPSVVSEHALRLGVWRLHGAGVSDPRTMVLAAQRAIVLHDLALAQRLARAASDAGGGFASALLEAQLLMWTGRAEEAEERYAELAPSAADDHDLALLTIGRIDNLMYNLGRWSEALALAERAEAIIEDPQVALEFVAYRVSLLDMGAGTVGDLQSLNDVIERGTGRAFPWACAMAGWKAARAGRVAEALDLTERGTAAHQMITWPPLPWGPETPAVLHGFALAFAGDFGRSRRWAQDIYARAVENNDLEGVSIAATNLVMTDVGEGRVTSARRWGQEAVSTGRRCGRFMALRVSLVYLAEALAIGGAPDDADRVLAELRTPKLRAMALLDSEATRVQAWVHVCRDNDVARAVPLLREAARIAVRTEDWVFESAALHDIARLGDAASVVERLTELAQVIEGPLIKARLLHMHALVTNDPAELSEAADQFERMNAGLLAAEAAAEAAVAWRRKDSRRARAADLRALDLRDRCPGAMTPGIASSSMARAALTKRQLVVARLAAEGWTNKQIAERLTLSVRTVENKLHECYSRLGITTRAELSSVLDQLDR